MPKEKLTYEFVKKEFEKRNYILLEAEYVNAHTKMKYKCCKGHENYIKYYSFQRGNGCLKCSGKQKHSYKFIKQEFEKRDYTLLEEEYKNAQTKMKYICSRGHISYINYCHLKNNHGCRKCSNINNSGKNNSQWNPNRNDIKLNEIIGKRCSKILRSSLIKTKQKKSSKTEEMLGFTRKQLKEHLQSFPNWNEIKDQTWHLDHKIPIKAFIEHDITDLKIINHLSNLQPLLAEENLKKSSKYLQEDFEKYMENFK